MDERDDVEIVEATGRVRVLARGSVATLLTFRHHPDAPHRDPEEERFDRPIAIFTTSGTWGMRCAAGSAEATPETVVVGAAGRTYRASHAGPRPHDTTVCVSFDRDAPAGSTEEPPEPDPVWQLAFGHPAAPRTVAIAAIQRALVREATDRRAGFAIKIDGLSMELVAELARAREATAPPSPARIRSDLRERVHRARGYLDEHLADDVALDALARSVALSPFYLSRLFRQEFGIPPHAYLSGRRLERGAELLTSTPLTVTQVSERVGWRSVSHFASRFRRRFGMSPSAYRRLAGR